LKILHLPINIAGQPIFTVKALRFLGFKANLISSQHQFEYETDIVLKRRKNIVIRQLSKFIFFIKCLINKYDIFHYHSGSFLFANIDVWILKLLKKRIFIEFYGSDVRLYDIEKKRNRFFISDNILDQKSKVKKLEFWSSITDTAIVGDHSIDAMLEPYFKNIYIIGQRIELDKYTPYYPDISNNIPLIVHAPSSKSIKGSKYVKQAIETLTNQNLSFKYIEVINMSHNEAISIYKKADIIIDQLIIGSYGVLACECMALGKPVICYMLEENISKYSSKPPIVNANPETITSVLKELILSPTKRNEIGKKSRLYAEQTHDSKLVAQKLINIYLGKVCE
jgi:glycosyltransferase involved in cell wall biosynthesis